MEKGPFKIIPFLALLAAFGCNLGFVMGGLQREYAAAFVGLIMAGMFLVVAITTRDSPI